VTRPKPTITATTHTLPFHQLSPRDFERLCLWLVEREGYERAEHLGAAGSEQGRDIVAWREGEVWAFQCKRVKRFGPQNAVEEVEKVLALPTEQRPVGLIFLATCDVSAKTRQEARERCAGQMECEFWAETELDERVKRHTDIVEEFFRAVVIYEGTKRVSIGHLLDACRAQVEGVLYDVRHKYDPKLYVNRAVERELSNFFDIGIGDGNRVRNCYLIVAPAGSGKTNLLCEIARVRAARQPVVLLVGANTYLGGSTGLLAALQAELEAASSRVRFRSAGDCLHTLHRLAEELGRDTLVLLDAINEYDRPAQMRKAVEDLLRKTRGRSIKIVVTCRDYYWGLFKGRFWEGAAFNELPSEAGDDENGDAVGDLSRFARDEQERALDLYIEHYNIKGRPVGDAAEQCRHPLLLRFFCEAYRGQDVGEVEDIRLKELFDRYWEGKLDSIAERMIHQGDERLHDGLAAEVRGYLLDVAGHMLEHNVRAIPLGEMARATGVDEQYDDPRSVYGRIRDEFIILEEKARGRGRRKELRVAFVYEEFMEYVMARSLMWDWDRAELDEARILIEIERLTDRYESFAQILGVMVYLALMLKEERDVELWSLLLSKGKEWQKVVFEAFRKLPEEQLDAGVFVTLGEMLATGGEDVQAQALDVVKLERVGRAATGSVVGAVCDLTGHQEEAIRRRAVLALRYAGSDEVVVPVVGKAVSDSRRSVRENAWKALVERGEDVWEWVLGPLIAALGDEEGDVRRGAVQELGRLGDARAVEPLIAVLRDEDERVRRAAAEVLGQLGDARAVEALIAVLEDRDRLARRAAAEALGGLGDARAVEPLIAMLGDEDERVRRAAAEALGGLGDARAVEPLIAALKDEDERVRRIAAEALGGLGDVRAVEPLIAALRDEDEEYPWRAAADALGRLGYAVVEALITALGDKDVSVWRQVVEALGKLGDAWTVEALSTVLRDKDERQRRAAVKLLGLDVFNILGLPDAWVVEALITALGDEDERVRRAVAVALRMITERLSGLREVLAHMISRDQPRRPAL